MNKYSPVILLFLISMVVISGCNKDRNPVFKDLDYISQSGKTVYDFSYVNGVISEFIYRGVEDEQHDFNAIYKNGIIHQYTYPGNTTFVEFIYSPNNDTAWLVYNGNPDSVYAYYLLNSNGRVTNSVVYSEKDTTDLKFYYNDQNVTRIDVIKHDGVSTYGWYVRLEYDSNPNPWYDLNTLDDYRSFSKNNITNMNGKSYNRWEYDDDEYPVVLNSKNNGQFKYYYK